MRKLGVSPLRTFTIGFADARYNEAAYARLVAERFQTEHHEHVVTPQAREILDTLAWHYDEPFADSSAIPTYYVSRWTRESVTVALTGDAGDECFAGYDRYRAAQLAARLDWIPVGMRRALACAGTALPHSQPRTLSNRLYRFAAALAESPAQRYLAWVNVFRRRCWRPAIARGSARRWTSMSRAGGSVSCTAPERVRRRSGRSTPTLPATSRMTCSRKSTARRWRAAWSAARRSLTMSSSRSRAACR